MIALHRSRCVDWRPKPIVCFATTTTTTTTTVRGDRDEKNKVESTSAGVDPAGEEVTLLAVARASGRVEVWKKTQRVDSVVKVHGERRGAAASWLKVKDVPGIKSVVCKSLAWVRPRGGQLKLVGGTLEGSLVEIDLAEKRPKKISADAPGCGIWAVDASDLPEGEEVAGCTSLVACACDDGALRVFGTKAGDQDFRLVQTYPRAKCRLLSVAFHGRTSVVVGGSDGHLSHWDLRGRKERFAINGKFQRNLDVSIWSVGVLEGGDIVSGDSSGSVRIWDGKFGSLLKNFSLHKRDVLSVVCHKNKIFSAGVDGQVNLLTCEGKAGGAQQWGFKGKKRPHSHDVLALALAKGTLFSGGNDTRLVSYDAQSFLERHPHNLQAYGEIPHIQTAKKKGSDSAAFMLCQQLDAVEVWQIQTIDQDSASRAKLAKGREGQPLESNSDPKLLAVLSSGSNIHSSALSPDGTLVVYSNMSSLHLYSLSHQNEGKVGVTKAASAKRQLQNLQFTPNGKFVVGTNHASECCVLEANTLKEVHVFDTAAASLSQPLADRSDELLCVSPTSDYAAVTSHRRVILVLNLAKRSLHGVIKVEGAVSSLCFERETNMLLAGTVGQQVLFYDLETCSRHEEFAGHGQQVAKRLNFISGSIKNMSCRGDKKDRFVMLNTVRGLCFVNFGKPTKELGVREGGGHQNRKRSRSGHGLQLAAREGQNPRILPLEDPCLFACFLGEASALIVECPWLKALRDVPKPLQRKVYGMA